MSSSIDMHTQHNTATDSQEVLPESPFRGIEPFRFIDKQIFFARKQETQKLLRHITIYRGVLLYGESGTGKSSLINAGFIPAAIADGFAPERVRVQPRDGEEIIVERISVNGDGKPPYLPSIFGEQDGTPRVVLSTNALKEKLKESSAEHSTLLIFDQFEEVVTLFGEGQQGGTIQDAYAAQSNLFTTLVELLRNESLAVKLLFVFREDYLAKLTKLFMLYPNLPDQYLRLTAPHAEALGEIVKGPFQAFPKHFGAGFSDDLVEALTTAIKQRNEGGAINLSEVQIACLMLWESTDPKALFEQKGVQGLLEDYLSDSLNQLAPELRDPAVALLSRMITSAGTRNVISGEDLLHRVRDRENIDGKLLEGALRALEEDTKLVRRERRYDTHFYEIVSEFLVPWIRRQKIERDASFERRKLQEAENRKRRKALIWAGVILALGLGLGGYAWQEARSAKRELELRTDAVIASTKVQEARDQQKEAESERDDARSERQRAEQEKQNTENAKALVEKNLEVALEEKRQLSLLKDQLSAEKVALLTKTKELEGYLTSDAAARDQKYRDSQARITQLETEKREALLQKARAESDLQQKERIERDIRASLTKARQDFTRLEAQVNVLNNALAGRTATPSSLEEAIAVLYQKLDEANKERVRLENRIKNSSELQRFQEPANVLDELDDLKGAIENLKKILDRRK